MELLAAVVGKLLDPLLKMFLGQRFSLAELLLSNRSARKAGRAEAAAEVTTRTLEDVAKSQSARRAVSDNPADVVLDPYNRDNR